MVAKSVKEPVIALLKRPSHHVECMKCSECSHQATVWIVLVWRAHQQWALHACLQGPAERNAGEGQQEVT